MWSDWLHLEGCAPAIVVERRGQDKEAVSLPRGTSGRNGGAEMDETATRLSRSCVRHGAFLLLHREHTVPPPRTRREPGCRRSCPCRPSGPQARGQTVWTEGGCAGSSRKQKAFGLLPGLGPAGPALVPGLTGGVAQGLQGRSGHRDY